MRAFLMAGNGVPIHPRFSSAAEWPWTWARVSSYVAMLRSMYERAAMDDDPETATPPRYMWFDSDKVNQFFKDRRKSKKMRQ